MLFKFLPPLPLHYVTECIKLFRKNYGENFEHNIPENSFLLEFYPKGAPLEAMPIVLWNRTSYNASDAGRGRITRGGRAWVAEKVTQADQGNYTVKDDQGKVLMRSTLTVQGKQCCNYMKIQRKWTFFT